MVRFLLASVLMGMISMGQHKKEGELENRAGAIKDRYSEWELLLFVEVFVYFSIIGLQYTTPYQNSYLPYTTLLYSYSRPFYCTIY